MQGTFTEVAPGRRLAFSWHWQHEAQGLERQVVVDFETRDDDTLITVTHGGYGGNSHGAGDLEAERQGHLEGWMYFLQRLEKVLKQP